MGVPEDLVPSPDLYMSLCIPEDQEILGNWLTSVQRGTHIC